MIQFLILLLAFQPIYECVTALAVPDSYTKSYEEDDLYIRSAETHNMSKRFITPDAEWCQRQYSGPPPPQKPTGATCDYGSMTSYTVDCTDQSDGEVYQVHRACTVPYKCYQLDDIVMWNGQRGTDINCITPIDFEKWFIKTGQLPKSDTYCSPRMRRSFASANLVKFAAKYEDKKGKRKRVSKAWVRVNNWNYGIMENVDYYEWKGRFWENIDFQFCVKVGAALDFVTGYGWAKS